MAQTAIGNQVRVGFEGAAQLINFSEIQPLRLVSATIKKSSKYEQIAASIRAVGIIEPPVVARNRAAAGKYLLLDGHLRIEVLKDMGQLSAVCLISTDDEAFTYNKRVSRLATVQEHKMILKAIEQGVPDERIAKALNVNVSTLAEKKRLLDGICAEVVDLLKDKHIAVSVFRSLKKMRTIRQIEAAELMVAMNNYSVSYATQLLAATPPAQLLDSNAPKSIKGLTAEQISLMERESVNLERDLKSAEQSYGTDHLDLVLVKGFLCKLLGNARISRYLLQNHQDILSEFQKIVELERPSAS